MQTIQIQVNDSYLEKFLNLLQALPQDEIKVVDRECEENRRRFQKVLDDYKSGGVEFVPYEDGMDEINNWLENMVKQ